MPTRWMSQMWQYLFTFPGHLRSPLVLKVLVWLQISILSYLFQNLQCLCYFNGFQSCLFIVHLYFKIYSCSSFMTSKCVWSMVLKELWMAEVNKNLFINRYCLILNPFIELIYLFESAAEKMKSKRSKLNASETLF